MTHRILGYPNVVKTQTELVAESVVASAVAASVRPVGRYKGRALVANVASTVLALNPVPGIYRVCFYATASAGIGTTLTVTATWTDTQHAQSANLGGTALSLIALAGYLENRSTIQVSSGNVAFSTTIGGALTYDLDLVLERLS